MIAVPPLLVLVSSQSMPDRSSCNVDESWIPVHTCNTCSYVLSYSYTFSVFRFKSYLPHIFLWDVFQPVNFPLCKEFMCTLLSHNLCFLLFLSYEGTHGLSTVFLDLFLAAKTPPVNASGIVNIIINGDDLHPYRLYSYSSSDSSSSTIAAAAPDTADTTATTVAMSTTKSKQIRKIHNPVSVIFLSISMCTLQMVSLSDFSCTCCTPTHPIFFLPIINNSIAQNCLVYQWHRQRFLIKNETTCLAVSFFIVQQFFTNFWTDLLTLYTTKCDTLYDMFW